MNNWEKELKIIESLGKLYPRFEYIKYNYYRENDYYKAEWIYHLCTYQLKCRVPELEEFIKENNKGIWFWYKRYFKIRGGATWEREIEIIESLGKLYPVFISKYNTYNIVYNYCKTNNCHKGWWVYKLCRDQLKQRLPRLEEFIKENDYAAWLWYKEEFKIKDE